MYIHTNTNTRNNIHTLLDLILTLNFSTYKIFENALCIRDFNFKSYAEYLHEIGFHILITEYPRNKCLSLIALEI